MRYLRAGFQQNLTVRQSAIDRALEGYSQAQVQAHSAYPRESGWLDATKRTFGLQRIREQVWLLRQKPVADAALLRTILQEAKRTASTWNGGIYLVYLPHPLHLRGGRIRVPAPQELITVANDLNISMLDMTPIFAQSPNLHDRFFYQHHAHYAPKGYEAVGQSVLQWLETLETSQSASAR